MKTCKILLLLTMTMSMSFGADYIIYNVAQDVPMKKEDINANRNYFINMGAIQGLKEGTIVDVFREVKTKNHYQGQGERINYKVKIGELKVIHSQEKSAITMLNKKTKYQNRLSLEVDGFMIGDLVEVKTN